MNIKSAETTEDGFVVTVNVRSYVAEAVHAVVRHMHHYY